MRKVAGFFRAGHVAFLLGTCIACSGSAPGVGLDGPATADGGASGGGAAGGGTSAGGGAVVNAATPIAPPGDDAGPARSPGADAGKSEAGAPPDAGPVAPAGNPGGSCSTGVPALGQPVDVSHPTTVVGTGTPSSCTSGALAAAVANGGIITFDCGSAPVTLPIAATLNLPIDRSTVLDGGNRVTLDGRSAVQILRFDSPNYRANDSGLTLQHIALVNGKTTPTQAIPPAPLPCSQGWDDGEGGALYMRDGNLTVIDATFRGNHAAPLGPDTGGGAIYITGSKRGALIVSSTFEGNAAANAGAVGGLNAELAIYDSLFSGNRATGNGANSDDASKCSVINNGQHEVGSGGNGGAVYLDGNGVNVTLCGDAILGNDAGATAFGGGLFFTSDDMWGTLTIADTTMTGNTGGSWTNVSSGSVTNVGTAIGVNAKSITVKGSTLQGYP